MTQHLAGTIFWFFSLILCVVWLGSSLHWNSRKGGSRLIEKKRGFVRVIHLYDKTKIEGSIYSSSEIVALTLKGEDRANLLSKLIDKTPFAVNFNGCSLNGEIVSGYYRITLKNKRYTVELWMNRGDLNWLQQTLQSN